MMQFIYDLKTGKVEKKVFHSGAIDFKSAYPGKGAVDVPDSYSPGDYYVDLKTGKPVKKKSLPRANTNKIQADGQDVFRIKGLPKDTIVIWFDGHKDTVTDGVLEFETDMPGTYEFLVGAVQYHTQTYTVTAVEPV